LSSTTSTERSRCGRVRWVDGQVVGVDLAARQRHGEGAAAAGFRGDVDPAAEQLDDPLGDREAESGASLGACRGSVFERDEDPIQVSGVDPDAGVGNGECELVLSAPGDDQRDRTLVRELGGVADQVQQHLSESRLVGGHGDRDVVGDVEGHCHAGPGEPTGAGADVGGDLSDDARSDLGGLARRLETRVLEQVVDEELELLGLALGGRRQLSGRSRYVGATQQFGQSVQRVHLVAEFVAHPRHELGAHA
jgi:hypothetical protein